MILDAVADRFIMEVPGGVTPLALQKLLYYAQGWHLAARDEPLFDEALEAWRLGPVVPKIYCRFRDIGDKRIAAALAKTNPAGILSPSVLELLDWIIEKYGSLPANELVRRTHSEPPWKNTWGGRPKDDEGHDPIQQEHLRAFFKEEQSRLLNTAEFGPVVPTAELQKWAASCALKWRASCE